ncbi:conserved hypothetical protein; putative signal peptide [Bradyrhizobium sp. ORS 278]|uniref:hypothetical protein n=1 Tax=Bradyrhizobium sp. (strain ORS 278) TaxID=114615 RepID=UPI000150807B|nr:hypothetical protein [Bradyrhizobium sp. ORS 278]CAL79017.1 conserved hypothetical protein; putative signal peptide [Bradyrhizobium sp. ORS 278]
MVGHQYLFRSASAKLALAAVMATVLTAAQSAPTSARAAGPSTHPSVIKAAASDVTDVSARRRHRHVYRGNPAAGLAIMGAMIGTFGAIAAHSHDDDYYYGPGYYAGPGYYGPPVYYAPQPYYVRPYYGHPYYGPRVHYYHPY